MNQEDLSPSCKHKHMLKNGAPPDNFRVLFDIIEYLISVCVCVCVCVCVFKKKLISEHEIGIHLSDQGQGHCCPSKFSQLTTIQTVKSYNSTLVQASIL